MKLAMRKIVYILTFFVFFGSSLVPNDVYADVKAIDCDNSNTISGYTCLGWGPTQTKFTGVEINGDICYFEVHYKMRKCVDAFGDTLRCIAVTGIEMDPDCGCPTSGVNTDVIKAAIGSLLMWEHGDRMFGTTASHTVRVYLEGCMQLINQTDYDNSGVCVDSCCYWDYSVTVSEGTKIISDTNVAYAQPSCTYGGGPGGNPCEASCDALDEIDAGEINELYIPDCASGCCPSSSTATFAPNVNAQTNPFRGYIGSCSYTAYYEEKECEIDGDYDGKKDAFKLYKIVLDDDYNCSYYDISEIYEDALKQLISEVCANNADYDINDGDELYYQSQSCWAKRGRALYPCNSDECCSTTYTITRDPVEGFHAQWIDHSDPSSNCGDECDGNNYEEVCDENKISDYVPIISDVEKYEKQIKGGEVLTYVKPNPAEEEINVYYLSNFNGKTTLNVYNALGELVKRMELNKNGVRQVYTFSVSDMPSGIYYYQIITGNEQSAKGKFIVRE